MIKNFAELIDRLLQDPVKKKVAVVCAQDEHTLEAVIKAYKEKLISPVLIGEKEGIEAILKKEGADLSGAEIIDITDPSECARKACALAREGKVDAIMKGHLDTKTLMKVLVNKEDGISISKVMNILAFMESPYYHKLFTLTDVGLLTYPTKEQKQMALENAVRAYKALGKRIPRLLSFLLWKASIQNSNRPLKQRKSRKKESRGLLWKDRFPWTLLWTRKPAPSKGMNPLWQAMPISYLSLIS